MIDTEIFEYENCNNYTCFEVIIKMANKLIEEKGIKKSDIVEYRTEIGGQRKKEEIFGVIKQQYLGGNKLGISRPNMRKRGKWYAVS